MILLAFLAQTLRIAIPYLLAATGGVISERSGLIALGLEGYMLGGAFCGALASYYSGSPWVGLLGAAGGGAALALLYAVTAIRFRADQVVVGIAINLLAIGGTRLWRRTTRGSGNAPSTRVRLGNVRVANRPRRARDQPSVLDRDRVGDTRYLAPLSHAVRPANSGLR